MGRIETDHPDVYEFGEMLRGLEMDRSDSTIKKYMSRLALIKNLTECKTLEQFTLEGRVKQNWIKLINALRSRKATLSYANNVIAALVKYYAVMEITKPSYVARQGKGTFEQAEKANKHKVRKEDLTEFLFNHFPKIYTADLSDYSADKFMQERGRFLLIHLFFCGLRRSEARRSKVSDVIREKDYNAIIVRSQKTKEIFEREIKEKKYWECRDKYVKLLKQKFGEDCDWLFPNMFGGGTLSVDRIGSIVAGYHDMKGNWKMGVAESIWDKTMFSHIFRNVRTNDLLRYMPVDAVQEWRQDASINTTMVYVDAEQQRKRISEYMKAKPEDDWE